MNNISLFLQKYLSLGFKEEKIKNIIIETIKEVCNVEITKKQIKVTDQNINIEVFGAEKSEIFINKDKITEQIKSKISENGYNFSDREIF